MASSIRQSDYGALYRALTENLPESAIFQIDSAGMIGDWNTGVEKLLGYTEREFIGQPVSTLFTPEDNVRNVPAALRESAAVTGRVSGEHWQLRKDGFAVYLTTILISIPGPERASGFLQVMRHARDARRFAETFQNAAIGIAVADFQLRLLEANHAYSLLTGYTEQELAGGEIVSILHPDDLAANLPHLHRVIAGEIPGFVSDKRYLRKDGGVVWVRSSVSRLTDEAGNGRLVALVEDITQLKQIEVQLREAQRTEGISLLAAGIAHDFNNLLTTIIGNTSLALGHLSGVHPARPLLQAGLDAGARAADLVQQLLAYSGKGQFFLQRFNICQLVSDMVSDIKTSLRERIALVVNLPNSLPEIDADPAQVRHVLMNLVNNAAEAIGHPPGEIQISTGVEQVGAPSPNAELTPGEYVFLEVSDTGQGMDEETQKRIFDPFFTTKFVGRGLGLPATAGIVRAHKGSIQVRSAPGQGSTFRVLLPVAREEPPASG